MGELAQEFSTVIGNNPNNVPGLSFNLSSAGTAFEAAKLLQGVTGPENMVTTFSNAALDAMQSGLDPNGVRRLKSQLENSEIIE